MILLWKLISLLVILQFRLSNYEIKLTIFSFVYQLKSADINSGFDGVPVFQVYS